MPRELRQLKTDYQKHGLTEDMCGGKGSHSKWTHPLLPGLTVVLSGRDGDDAAPYQEGDLRNAIRRLQGVS
jgi:hypothetical protein